MLKGYQLIITDQNVFDGDFSCEVGDVYMKRDDAVEELKRKLEHFKEEWELDDKDIDAYDGFARIHTDGSRVKLDVKSVAIHE